MLRVSSVALIHGDALITVFIRISDLYLYYRRDGDFLIRDFYRIYNFRL